MLATPRLPSGSAVQAPAGAARRRSSRSSISSSRGACSRVGRSGDGARSARGRSDDGAGAAGVRRPRSGAGALHQRAARAEGRGDPAPHIQNFLPAVLPALRLGVRLIGRGRVVGFLAGFLGKMIGKLVGPQTAPALSRAIVDAGLKLLTLEVSSQDEARAAASSVAATVEETVGRVSALPDYVLDNQELLEGFALEAFEQAAAANLPPVLSEAVYRERPDLLEGGVKTCWVMLPLRRRKRYKKCARDVQGPRSVRTWPTRSSRSRGRSPTISRTSWAWRRAPKWKRRCISTKRCPGRRCPISRARNRRRRASGRRTQGDGPSCIRSRRSGRAAARASRGWGATLPPGATHRRHVGAGQRLYRLSIPGRRLLTGRPGTDGRGRGGWAACGSPSMSPKNEIASVYLPERGQGAAAGRAAAAAIASRRARRRVS